MNKQQIKFKSCDKFAFPRPVPLVNHKETSFYHIMVLLVGIVL